jgi:hypothetical protein
MAVKGDYRQRTSRPSCGGRLATSQHLRGRTNDLEVFVGRCRITLLTGFSDFGRS